MDIVEDIRPNPKLMEVYQLLTDMTCASAPLCAAYQSGQDGSAE